MDMHLEKIYQTLHRYRNRVISLDVMLVFIALVLSETYPR